MKGQERRLETKRMKYSPPQITCFDDIRLLKLVAPEEILHPKTHLLTVMSEDYRAHGKLIAYTDPSGVTFPLNTWMEMVPAINRFFKTCVQGKRIETFYADDTHQPSPIPSGMHLFSVPREITEDLIRDALREAKDIYWSPKHRENKNMHMSRKLPSPACNILFYPEGGKGMPKIKDIVQILFAEAPSLAKYTLIYLSVIRDILRLDDSDMEAVSLALNHYDPMGGINPHVDTVFMFKGTLGPIFTVAMGPSEKMLDLLPIFMPDTYRPMRLFSQPNEIMMMDGESRVLWAHSKPWNVPHDQFTLVFKFPELRTRTHAVPFEYEGQPLSVPYHYVSPVALSPA
jgi:hypothetical protein